MRRTQQRARARAHSQAHARSPTTMMTSSTAAETCCLLQRRRQPSQNTSINCCRLYAATTRTHSASDEQATLHNTTSSTRGQTRQRRAQTYYLTTSGACSKRESKNMDTNKHKEAARWALLAMQLLVVLTAMQGATCARTSSSSSSVTSYSPYASSSLQANQSRADQQQRIGELIAMGAIALHAPTPDRLVDRIASPSSAAFNLQQSASTQQAEQQQQQQHANKLDYIVEFMRNNKLTKFCDLLTSQDGEVRALRERLNALNRFTLFVPTNEAMLLVPSALMQRVHARPHDKRAFLLAHATGELVMPKHTGAQLALSLDGSPMRVATFASSNASKAQQQAKQLELIVNGANVLSGQSYALQEPHNSSVTYAVVHLIDRALYAPPATSLMERVRVLAPRMANYVELALSMRQRASESNARSPQLQRLQRDADELFEWLESPQRVSTLFLANDDAFKATPHKLLEPLDSNRTFLMHFVRSHLVDGLYYSGQLAAMANSNATNKLRSLAHTQLDVDAKTLQSRTLVLINSVPVVEADLMALNGLVHVISRPLFERHQLEACNCSASSQHEQANNNNNRQAYIYEQLWPKSNTNATNNWLRAGNSVRAPNVMETSGDEFAAPTPQPPNSNNNELERERDNLVGAASQRVRSQRSQDDLVARNNRDFYRPSAAPANLVAASFVSTTNAQQPVAAAAAAAEPAQKLAALQQGGADEWPKVNSNLGAAATPAPLFDRYKIVVNATSRQRLREQLQQQRGSLQPLVGDELQHSSNNAPRFVYDKPSNGDASAQPPRRSFAASDALNATNESASENLHASAASREHRLLKFRPEDARDVAPGMRLTKPSAPLQALKSQLVASKTGSSGNNFGGCAFYDPECKRLVGRLVRLPPLARVKTAPSAALIQNTTQRPSFVGGPIMSGSSHDVQQQHLDSTFGEVSTPATTANNWLSNNNRPAAIMVTPTTALVLAPAPVAAKQWPSGAKTDSSDIARIVRPNNATIDASVDRSAKILLVPVKVIHEPISGQSGNGSSQAPRTSDKLLLFPASMVAAAAAAAAAAASQQQQQQQQRPQQSRFVFSHNNQMFHTPTPNPVSHLTTHRPLMFGHSAQLNKPASSNFTFDATTDSSNDQQQQQQYTASKLHQQLRQRAQNASAALRLSLDQLAGLKQARKIVHLQPSPHDVSPHDDFGGDISITSAKLQALPIQQQRTVPYSPATAMRVANLTAMLTAELPTGLATLPSDQSPDSVSLASATQRPPAAPSSSSAAADYFQNRTIAEIMDDSGLRIDGQQVTFSRFKECLAEANLLGLVTQAGSSMTIFLPTDSAYLRLVQQQALAYQRERAAGTPLATRLLEQRRHFVPLVARVRSPSAPMPTVVANDIAPMSGAELGAASSSAANSVAERLSLDCSSNQVRQILLDHMSSRLITPKQLHSDVGISSLSGRRLLLSSVPTKKIVVVDGQPVIAATRAKNGMVYVINKFLNITHQPPNVVELMETQQNLSTFVSYLQFSSLAERLKRETGPLTVLAPSNEAFEQLSASARRLINSDPSVLMDVLRGHIVEGVQFGKLISMRSRLKTMNHDQSIEARVIRPNVYSLDDQMTSMRLIGTTGNGVVNQINRLIVPAWLRVSMSSQTPPRPSPPGVSRAQVSTSTTSSTTTLDSVPGELDASTARLATFASNNNNNNELARLIEPLRASNNISSTARFSPSDVPSEFDVASQTAKPQTLMASPFLRVAANLTSGQSNWQAPKQQQQLLRTPLTARMPNATRNMELIEKLAGLMDARRFVEYLLRSRVADALKPDMNYVILVPTDEAIERLPRQIIDMLERDADRLADLINYHVLDTTFEYINTIPDGQTLNTLNEKEILFNWHRNNTVLTASGAVVMGGIQEDNIALLVVDRVLYPTPGNLLSIVSKSPILTNFTQLLHHAQLESQLTLSGPYTLFAPSDFAFNQLERRQFELLHRNKESARRFLLRHLSQPAVFTSSIALSNATAARASLAPQSVPTMTITNSLGEDLQLRQRDEYFSVNEVNFSYADVAATNGVVHVIDGIL